MWQLSTSGCCLLPAAAVLLHLLNWQYHSSWLQVGFHVHAPRLLLLPLQCIAVPSLQSFGHVSLPVLCVDRLLLLLPQQVEWYRNYLAAQEEDGFIGTFAEFLDSYVSTCAVVVVRSETAATRPRQGPQRQQSRKRDGVSRL